MNLLSVTNMQKKKKWKGAKKLFTVYGNITHDRGQYLSYVFFTAMRCQILPTSFTVRYSDWCPDTRVNVMCTCPAWPLTFGSQQCWAIFGWDGKRRLFLSVLSDSAAIAHVLQRSRRQLKCLYLSVRLCVSPKRDSKACCVSTSAATPDHNKHPHTHTHTLQQLCVHWHRSAEAVNCVGCRLRSHCQFVSTVGLMAAIFTA